VYNSVQFQKLFLLFVNKYLFKSMQNFETLLKQEVEKLFGKKITIATDCTQLSKLVLQATNENISSQTIRRFWGIVKYENKISNFTRNVLSKYIGYKDYNDFINKVKNNEHCKPNIDFTIIENLFKHNTKHTDNWNLWHEGMSVILAENILNNKSLFEQFTQHLHTNQSAMNNIMANFQCYSLLQYDWYIKGLRIFCNNSKETHHVLYCYELEYLGCLLNNREKEGTYLIPLMTQQYPKIIKKYGIIPPLNGAYYGCLIANAFLNNKHELVDKYFNEAIAEIERNKNTTFKISHDVDFRSFVHCLVEILNWIGLYDKALYLFTNFEFKTNNPFLWYFSQVEMLNLETAIIYFQAGNKAKASKLFNNLEMNYIRFDRRDIVKIQYLLLHLGLTNKTSIVKRKKIKQSIIDLCNKTGLLHFKNLIPRFEECM
jgi:hypothetical protein